MIRRLHLSAMFIALLLASTAVGAVASHVVSVPSSAAESYADISSSVGMAHITNKNNLGGSRGRRGNAMAGASFVGISSISGARIADPTLYKEFELLLRPQQGSHWPPSRCAASGEGFAKIVTDALQVPTSSFTVVAKIFDTVVMQVNTTGLHDGDSGAQLNATALSEIIVTAVHRYANTSTTNGTAPTNSSGDVYYSIGTFFVGQCEVWSASLDYQPVKVPNYLRQEVENNRTGFWVLGGFAGFCIILQAVYGFVHRRRFDMVVLKDADEQGID